MRCVFQFHERDGLVNLRCVESVLAWFCVSAYVLCVACGRPDLATAVFDATDAPQSIANFSLSLAFPDAGSARILLRCSSDRGAVVVTPAIGWEVLGSLRASEVVFAASFDGNSASLPLTPATLSCTAARLTNGVRECCFLVAVCVS